MAQVLALPPIHEEPKPETFAERWGGFLVSLFFHLMVLVLLATAMREERRPSPMLTQSVQLNIAPSLPSAAPAQPLMEPPPPSVLSEVARTSPFGDIEDQEAHDNTPSDVLGTPDVGPADAPDPETTSTPAALIDSLDGDEPAPLAISEALRQRIAEQTQLAAADIERQHIARTQMRGRLWNELDQNRTRNAEFISDGGLQGTIREMDFSGVPLDAVRQVLRRYGAEMEERELTPADVNEGPIPVNAARIGDQVLTAQRGSVSGRALLITFGHELTARLEELEVNALARAGININDVAVTRIVFGVDQVYSGYDFRVRDIQWVKVEEE